MNSGVGSPSISDTKAPTRFGPMAPLTVLVVCLVLGVAAVVWRGTVRAGAARARTQAELAAQTAAIESQFSQPLRAAEVLGALARQSGGPIPNFQKVAGDLLTAFPDLACLELEPGGIVSEIVPRSGNERVTGFNALKDPVHRPSANAALQSRRLTVAGPLALFHGETGFIVRVPIFQRGRDGREYFWGFVAVSMRLPQVIVRSRLDEAYQRGYDYMLFVPGPSPGKETTIFRRGNGALNDAVQQTIRAENLQLRLALRPTGGWVNTTKVVLDVLGVLLASCLVYVLLRVSESRRELEAMLAETNRRLACEPAERKRAEEKLVRAQATAATNQAELDRSRSALQEVQSSTAILQARLEAAEARLKQTELNAQELQTRFDSALSTANKEAKAKATELEKTREDLQASKKTINDLQARLVAAERAEKSAALASQTLHRKDQETIAELQARFDAQSKAAKESALASLARVKEVETTNQNLKAQLLVAEQAQAHVREPTKLLQPTPAESQLRQEFANELAPPPAVTKSNPPKPETDDPGPEPVSPAVSNLELASEASPPPSNTETKPAPGKPKQRKSHRHDNQMDLFVAPPAEDHPLPRSDPKASVKEPAAEVHDSPPVDPAQLRKAVNLILPLLTDRDPGAKDCLKANRGTFRSAFASAAYVEFEQMVKEGNFDPALEQLRKAAKRQGISV